jgi:hypothetical protein
MEYCENRQYGNMGCGITAIDNIKNNLSKSESLHLKNDDQIVEVTVMSLEKVKEELCLVDCNDEELEAMGLNDNFIKGLGEEKTEVKGPAETINDKVSKGSVIKEGLLRVDIVSTLSTLQSKNFHDFEKELIKKYDEGGLILDSTPTISFKELNNLDKIQAKKDESDADFAARLQEAEIRAGGLKP